LWVPFKRGRQNNNNTIVEVSPYYFSWEGQVYFG